MQLEAKNIAFLAKAATPPLDERTHQAAARRGLGLEASRPRRRAAARKISKRYEFADFLGAMAFVDKMAALAEREGHHPDFCVHYSRVDVTLWTHAARGLSENDFILASKLDAIVS